jgi:pSer/pThr/pTyr-binding forkhead associated (FHA) protein
MIFKLNDLLKSGRRIITIGRQDPDATNSISIRESGSCYISRKHCTLEWDEYTRVWNIRDGQWDKNATNSWKNSLNGTYVNSTEISHFGQPFFPGDILSIGDTKLRAEGY